VRIHLQVAGVVRGPIVSLGEGGVGVDHGRSPDNRRVRPGCRNGRTLAAGDAASVLVLSYADWMMAICGGVVLRAQEPCVEWARGGAREVGLTCALSGHAVSTQSRRVQFRLLYSPTLLLLLPPPPPPPRNPCIRRRDCQ
jgi:hypothetical protein